MAVKTITITEEAYNALRRIKHGDRSFSEVIIEVAGEKKNNFDKYFGILRGSKTLSSIRKNLKKSRMQADIEARRRERKLHLGKYDSS